jgi:riboflavin biosynthesis pyrimidine reductase
MPFMGVLADTRAPYYVQLETVNRVARHQRSEKFHMKPHVICLMACSVDGRTLPSRWRPKGAAADHFERVHEELGGDAWLIGRVTGQEFAKGKPYPASTEATFPREPWFARRDAKAYGVVLDTHGRIAWGRSDIGGDPIVVVLAETVSDAHLAGLRSEGVSYVFAGKSELDLALTLDILSRELGVKRLLLEGGGGANGAFVRAGLVDELHLVICPAIDGAKGAPSVFDSPETEADQRAPITAMTLEGSRALEGGAMLLTYRIVNEAKS